MAAELGAAAAVSGVSSKATESAFDFIQRQICFVFQYKKYIEDLKKQVEELTDARERIQHSVDYARRQGEVIEKDVERWLINIDNFMERIAKPMIQNEDKAKNYCFKGLCPNLIKRYKLGKEALKAANDGDNLLNKSKNFSTVSYYPVLQKTESMYVRGYEAFDSRMSAFQDIMEALKDANINLIGVYGMGGVGKTTLVKKVAWKAVEDTLFDKVVMVEVTETPDYKRIQENIAHELGLEFDKETEPQRVGRIRDKLKKEKRVLIILDNIWRKLDLEAVGIPFGYDAIKSAKQMEDREERKDDQRQCKMLLTSRNQYVLSNDMNTQKNILVEILSEGEAENLFGKIVGDLFEKPSYRCIATQIIRKCAGLPLAIATIANALKRKELFVWNDTLNSLEVSSSRQISGMDTNVFSTIELSYKFLERVEARKIFLLCSLYNAGYEIFLDDLLSYGMGLGLFRDLHTLDQKRTRLYTLIDDLKASCLLLDVGIKNHVKMHDIIHVVAVSIASTDEHMLNIQDVIGLKQMLEEEISKDSTAISLPFKGTKELPEKLEFSKLEMFSLLEDDRSLQIPDLFFEGTRKLKVLELSGIHLLSLPSSFHSLTNLRTLFLEDCLLGDIAMVGKLKRLEILSFFKSDIEQLPREIGQLTRLKYLDLRLCLKLKVIAPNVIAQLTQLEELYMGNSFAQWEANGLNNQGRSNASLIELKELSHLTMLQIHVPDAQIMPSDLDFMKLERYKIVIGDVWNWPRDYETSKALKIKLNNDISLMYAISNLLKRTEDLYLSELNAVKNVCYELDSEGFPHLKHLQVESGSELSYIIHSEGSTSCTAFPILESLSLRKLINLERICHCQLTAESLGNLRMLNVEECDRLKHLFSFSLAKNLSQLENIEVTNCKNLTVILSQESEDHVIQNEKNNKIEFSQLRSLTLQHLPQLKSFGLDMNSSVRSQPLFPSNMGSTEIILEDGSTDFMALFNQKVVLPRLENFKLSSTSIEKIWLNQRPAILSYSQTLTSINVEKCSGLKFLFSSSMVKCLEQLQVLVVDDCKLMEGIIDKEGLRGEEKISNMIFPKLSELELKSLPKLTRFGTGDLVEFCSLTHLHVENCPNLVTFFASSPCEKMLSREPDAVNLENCSAGICPLFDRKVALPNIKEMILSGLDKLQMIWHHQLHDDSFSKLQVLRVEHCKKLLIIVPSYALGRLSTLEDLHISNCASLEVVSEFQELNLVEATAVEEERIRKMLFPKLNYLKLNDLPRVTRFCNFTGNVIELSSLSGLWICNCPSMETFVSNFLSADMTSGKEPEEMNSEQNFHTGVQPLFDKMVSFPSLEILAIKGMNELTKIWDNQLSLDSFCKLNQLWVMSCNKLFNIFPSNMLGILQNLEVLTIQNCASLEEIVEVLEKNFLTVEETIPRFVFTKLTSLQLWMLPSLKSLYSGIHISKWPILRKLSVHGCDTIQIFASKFLGHQETHGECQQEIPSQQSPFLVEKDAFPSLEALYLSRLPKLLYLWKENSQPSNNFRSLTILKVSKCGGLRYLLTYSIAKSLVQLKRLVIAKCETIKTIITHSGDEVKDQIVFNQLEYLELHYLWSLKSFYSGEYNLEFPSLKQVIVNHCSDMEIFSRGALNTPKLQSLKLTEEDDEGCWEGNLNSTIKQLFNKWLYIPAWMNL